VLAAVVKTLAFALEVAVVVVVVPVLDFAIEVVANVVVGLVILGVLASRATVAVTRGFVGAADALAGVPEGTTADLSNELVHGAGSENPEVAVVGERVAAFAAE
jgi:nucleoside diphosphate kinase